MSYTFTWQCPRCDTRFYSRSGPSQCPCPFCLSVSGFTVPVCYCLPRGTRMTVIAEGPVTDCGGYRLCVVLEEL